MDRNGQNCKQERKFKLQLAHFNSSNPQRRPALAHSRNTLTATQHATNSKQQTDWLSSACTRLMQRNKEDSQPMAYLPVLHARYLPAAWQTCSCTRTALRSQPTAEEEMEENAPGRICQPPHVRRSRACVTVVCRLPLELQTNDSECLWPIAIGCSFPSRFRIASLVESGCKLLFLADAIRFAVHVVYRSCFPICNVRYNTTSPAVV